MQGFSYIMKAYSVEDYRACATSAMRDAKNGKEITDAILRESGIDIQIITGKDEADIISEAGGLGDMIDKRDNYLYVDVGGGSTEVVVYANKRKIVSHSFQLGTVRMLVDAVKEEEMDFFKSQMKEIYRKYMPVSIIASGGNINKIHKVLGKREKETLAYSDIKNLYDSLKGLSYE